jgi:tight adherence protein B
VTGGPTLASSVAAAPQAGVAQPVLAFALLAFFLGTTVLIATVLGAITRAARPEERIRRRLSFYTLTGRQARLERQVEQRGILSGNVLTRSAVELAGRVTERRGLGDVIDSRLAGAALPVTTPEWVVLHVGGALGLTLLFLLISKGGLLPTICGLTIGLVGPWLFLLVRRGRRETAFLSQLPDTLQMLAGSLQAGYSLPQALDAVVREGQPPMSVEFNRALVESRLDVPVEDALEGIGRRLSSQDFSWVVMAVRIQRDVGGNLAELLMTVADTLRERERLRRQVKVLSAEGRLSGWILGGLPVVFFLYLVLANPTYLRPLWTTPLGVAMMVLAILLLAAGAFWLRRVIKVEV